MSAFGQAGFGSRNRRNQLRSQGQMDPYGQQVRAAKQAPTFNVYQAQGTQQATGQQRAPSQSQPAQQPAAAQPSAPAMPAYSQSAAPLAVGVTGSPRAAQTIQPQTQGTPYSPQSVSPGQATAATGATDYSHMRGILPQNVDPARWDELAKGGAFGPGELNWIKHRRMVEAEHLRLNALRGHPGDEGEALWRQQQEVEATVKQQAQSQSQPAQQPAAAQPSAPAMPAYRPSYSAGTAQPIQPQSQGTPYGADPGYADRVAAAAQQWNSTPAGSQKRDWEGNTVRGMLAGGLPLDMAARVLETNSTRYSGNPAGASQFANQTEQDWIASLSSGPPQAPGPNATADEHSAYLNASNAYGRQQKAKQARDERIAAEAAFNDPARTAGEPSQRWIDETRRRVIDWGEVPFGMHPFAFRQNLIAGKIDISGRPVTEETPAWARYDYQRPQSAPAAIQTIGNTPGQAQPIQPQSQGTPYQSQPMVNDRPMRSIEDDMAADRDYERQNGWWAQESARRGVDQLTGAPLANRSDEQAAYHRAAYAPDALALRQRHAAARG